MTQLSNGIQHCVFEVLEEPNLHENGNLVSQPSFMMLLKRCKFLMSFLPKYECFEKKSCYLDVFKARDTSYDISLKLEHQ